MQRIAILGNCGTGKSTLARRLSKVLDIEVTHLDALWFLADWVEREEEDFQAMVANVARREQWIIDGNYSRTWAVRLPRADTVIVLECSRLRCLYRVIKRWWKYRGNQRPDMATGCLEKIDFEFIRWVWSHPKRNPEREDMMKEYAASATIHRLRVPRDVAPFLNDVATNKKRPA